MYNFNVAKEKGGKIMASNCSFDIVSEINMQEMDNAVNQTVKEITQRYDFKGAVAEVQSNEEEVKIHAQDDFKLESILEILKGKMIKRGLSPRFLDENKLEPASGGTVRQVLKIKKGISKENAKVIIQDIKNSKIKVQAQIMDDVVRVSGKDKDDLQKVIQMIKGKDYGIELQFTNFRS
jgi:cyclic-di-GMP-binding protein